MVQTHPLAQLATKQAEALPAATLDLPNPLIYLNIATEAASPFRHRLTTENLARRFRQPAICLYRYAPGTLVAGGGAEPYTTLSSGCLVREQLPEWAADAAGLARDIAAHGDAPLVQQPCLLAARYGDVTWGHFFFEMLSKIVLAEAIEPKKFTYVVPARTTQLGGPVPDGYVRAVLEALQAYGIEEHRLLRLPRRGVVAFDALFDFSGVFPVPGQGFFGPHPGLAALMAETVSGGTDRVLPEKPYLVRGGGDFRQIGNRNEVAEIATRHGFTPVDLIELSFVEQVGVFRGAKAVAGALGSGFAGLIFGAPELPVTTLAPAAWNDTYFVNIFQKQDAYHADVRGVSSAGPGDSVIRSSYHVPPADFAHALDLVSTVKPAGLRQQSVQIGTAMLPRRLGAEKVSWSFGVMGSAAAYLAGGWAPAEAHHTWSVGPACALHIPHAFIGGGDVWIEAAGFAMTAQDTGSMRRLTLTINGEALHTHFVEGESRPIWFVPGALLSDGGGIRVGFEHPDCASPHALGRSADTRLLGFGFQRLTFWGVA